MKNMTRRKLARRAAGLGLIAVLCGALFVPAHGAFDWQKMLGFKTKPKHVWTPRRGPVFNWQKLSSTPLNARVLSTEIKDGIVTQQVMFHSEMDGKKSVDIFAFYSYPQKADAGKTGEKLPAFVWIEGGLAQAKTYRTIFGAKRGYATLAIDFPQPGYRSTGDYPINLAMELGENPKQAPIYHGAVALLKAVSFLEAQPQVDKNRIGMAGSSWGGFYTTLMTGIDPRIKAAACMFGAGNLQMGNMWWDAYGRSPRFPAELREHWRTSLDPAFRLPKCKTPIAWFTGTNDWFFWMPAVMKTYEMAGGPKSLTLLPNWDHALSGEVAEQPFVWLDAHLKGKAGFIEPSPLRVKWQDGALWAQWDYSGPRRARSADLIISWGDGNWHTRCWQTRYASIKQGVCRTRLPDYPSPYFIAGSITDALGYRTSTPLLRVDPAREVPSPVRVVRVGEVPINDPVLETNGCENWGDFERGDCVFLRRHGWWKNGSLHDALSADAFSGQKSLILPEGTTRLPILRFTQGYTHRLTFWAKAATPLSAPLTIGVRFNGGFCGEAKDVLRWARVGTQWTRVSFDVEPHEDLNHRYNASLILPPGAQLKVDQFSFRPVPKEPITQTANNVALKTGRTQGSL